MKTKSKTILDDLLVTIEGKSYFGYDPWDGLNSCIINERSNKFLKLFLFHSNSHSPFNLRKTLGVKKTLNAKGLSLMIETYINMFKNGNNSQNIVKVKSIISKLLLLRSKEVKNMCWGYPFPWETPSRSLERYSPNVVTTGFIIRSFDKYLDINRSKEMENIILSSSKFVLEDLNLHDSDDGLCFSYTPKDNYQVINASLLATEILSCAYKINKSKTLKDICESSLSFVFANQRAEGSWDYALTHKTGLGLEKGQIDWHQGFVLDSIFNINNNLGNSFGFIEQPFMNGLKFYKENQFTALGQSFWRWPRLWPADIHNQAQGIISFSKYKKYDKELEALSIRILEWTIENFYSYEHNYFYFRKWPLLTIKIPYMRYSQMWMANALSFFLNDF